MKDRSLRLKAIRKIIKANRIKSQENLLNRLQDEGFSVTQATLSRDLKLLKVGKISEGMSGYYYTMPSEEEQRETERNYVQDFVRGYVSIEFSDNVGVIRTLTGHADSVAISLDSLGLDEVLGTVAGDDTVLVVLRPGVTGEQLLDQLRTRFPDLEE